MHREGGHHLIVRMLLDSGGTLAGTSCALNCSGLGVRMYRVYTLTPKPQSLHPEYSTLNYTP